jgi:ABC-2 type transport system ATP-binding protein
MTSTGSILEAHALSKSFGSNVALHELNLSVRPGEVVCLLGANGAGKTTTINLFLGFLQPDGGAAFVADTNVAADPLSARRKLAYIPEAVALYPRLSGLENLQFFDRLAGNNRSSEELSLLLERAGLQREARDRRASTYSKGMRQKVGIAIAMARDAKALLLDEPLSGLDPAAANSLCRQIDRMRDDGRAVLMATHDIFRAKEVGNRIGIMMHGRLVDELEAERVDAREIEHIYLEHIKEAAARTQAEAA